MKIRAVLSCVTLSVGLLIALPGAANASASSEYESSVGAYTNRHRVNHDRVRVRTQSCVDGYAERHARWMASNRTLKHQSMSRILTGCRLSRVGENVAYGYTSGSKAVTAWMKSSGHRANILNSKFRLIGVGAYRDSKGRWWVAQVFGTLK